MLAIQEQPRAALQSDSEIKGAQRIGCGAGPNPVTLQAAPSQEQPGAAEHLAWVFSGEQSPVGSVVVVVEEETQAVPFQVQPVTSPQAAWVV